MLNTCTAAELIFLLKEKSKIKSILKAARNEEFRKYLSLAMAKENGAQELEAKLTKIESYLIGKKYMDAITKVQPEAVVILDVTPICIDVDEILSQVTHVVIPDPPPVTPDAPVVNPDPPAETPDSPVVIPDPPAETPDSSVVIPATLSTVPAIGPVPPPAPTPLSNIDPIKDTDPARTALALKRKADKEREIKKMQKRSEQFYDINY